MWPPLVVLGVFLLVAAVRVCEVEGVLGRTERVGVDQG